jgi:competence ComEA-like helix-hairpin-helix protein
MKLLEKLSRKFGFTRTETNVIIFIAGFCLLGVAVNIIKISKNNKAYLEFDYKVQDSLFNAASGDSKSDSVGNIKQKKFDSQRELLDFTSGKTQREFSGKALPGNKININTASADELVLIPGVGKATAGRIIQYRARHKKFKKFEELLNVKGIGKAKLNKMKEAIILE